MRNLLCFVSCCSSVKFGIIFDSFLKMWRSVSAWIVNGWVFGWLRCMKLMV